MKKEALAKRIEHTTLKPEVTGQEIERLCREAIEFGFFGVCVAPFWILCI